MDNINFLQQTGKGHCFICHSDYDNNTGVGIHACVGTPTPGGCSKCVNWMKNVEKRNWGYCPHCGKELK